jgi:hypothetical protein
MSQHDGTPEGQLGRESRRRRSSIGLFIAVTFGMMALVSVPLSPLARLHFPTPIMRALGPVGSVVQPLFDRGLDRATSRADASVTAAAERGGSSRVAVGFTGATGTLAANTFNGGHKPPPPVLPVIKSPPKGPIVVSGNHIGESVTTQRACSSRLRCEARRPVHRHRAH